MSLSRRRVVIYYPATSFDRAITRSNETYIRTLLEQVELVAIILHAHCDKRIQHNFFKLTVSQSQRSIKRYINRRNTCSND